MGLSIQAKIKEAANNNKNIRHGYCGMAVNEGADRAAKEQTTSNDQQINEKPTPHSYMGETIKRSVRRVWQRSWNETPPDRNHMKSLKPEIKYRKTSHNKNRKFETILSRLRIGHTNFNHSYRMLRL